MNKRQRKKLKKQEPEVTLQQAWNVVAEHLNKRENNYCHFTERVYSSEGVQLKLYESEEDIVISKILEESAK